MGAALAGPMAGGGAGVQRYRRRGVSSVLRSFVVVVGLSFALATSACGSPVELPSEGEETLAAFMGWDSDGAEWHEKVAEVEERIRACMAEQGFEYIPEEVPARHLTEQDEEEFIRTWGFEITTVYEEDDAALPEPEDDPNWDLVEAMSDSEEQAYYEALYGTDDDNVSDASIYGAGCQGEADEAVHGLDGPEELWAELGPLLEVMYERVDADPRIIARNDEWAQCMADAGHDYATRDDMHAVVYDDFERRLHDLLGSDDDWFDPFQGWSDAEIEAFFDERTDEEIDAFFDEAEHRSRENVDWDALSALQQEEIALAVADYDCREGEAFEDLYQQVSRAYETEFIAENREALDRLRNDRR